MECQKRQSRKKFIFFSCCIIALFIGITPTFASAIGDLLISVLGWLISGISMLLLGLIETVANLFLSVMAIDLSQLESMGFFRGFNEFVVGIRLIAVTLASVSLLWQLFAVFFGPFVGTKQISSIGNIVSRALIFIPLTYLVQPLAMDTLRMFQDIYNGFFAVYRANPGGAFSFMSLSQIINPETFLSDLGISLSSVFNGEISPLADVVSILISCIFMILITWNFVKLLLEMTQRFVVMLVYVYLSPLASACGVGPNSISISKQALTLFVSSGVLWILNVWSVGIALSLFGSVGSAMTAGATGFFLWAVVTYGFLKIAQQLDDIFTSVGATNVRFSGSLLDDLVSMAKMGETLGRSFKNFNAGLGNFAEHGLFSGRGSNSKNPVQPSTARMAGAMGSAAAAGAATGAAAKAATKATTGSATAAAATATTKAPRTGKQMVSDAVRNVAAHTAAGRVVRGVKQTADNVRSRVGAGVAEAKVAQDNQMMGAVGNALGKATPEARAAAMNEIASNNPQILKNDAVKDYLGDTMGLKENQSVVALSVDKGGQLAGTVATTNPDGTVTMSRVTGLNDVNPSAHAGSAGGAGVASADGQKLAYPASQLDARGADAATLQYTNGASGEMYTAQVERGARDIDSNGKNSLFTVTSTHDGHEVGIKAPSDMTAAEVGAVIMGTASAETMQKFDVGRDSSDLMSRPERVHSGLNMDTSASGSVVPGTAFENNPDTSFAVGGANGVKFERVDAGGGSQGHDVWSASASGHEVGRFEAPHEAGARDVADMVMKASDGECAAIRTQTGISAEANPNIEYTPGAGGFGAAAPGSHSDGTKWDSGIKMGIEERKVEGEDLSGPDFRYKLAKEDGSVVTAHGYVQPMGDTPEMPPVAGKVGYMYGNNHGSAGCVYIDASVTPEQLAAAIVSENGGRVAGVREIRDALGIKESFGEEETKQLKDALEKARRARKKGVLTSEDNPMGANEAP